LRKESPAEWNLPKQTHTRRFEEEKKSNKSLWLQSKSFVLQVLQNFQLKVKETFKGSQSSFLRTLLFSKQISIFFIEKLYHHLHKIYLTRRTR
jgi:hypothetical protein